jgi:CheY-like chemotaxis protein
VRRPEFKGAYKDGSQERDMSALVILVNADRGVLRQLEAQLSENGYMVMAMETFIEARDLLDSVIPDLLVADIRLERFNGLQLAIRSHFEHPDVPVAVTHVQDDPVVEAEAKRYGVSFFPSPLENPKFLSFVRSLVDSRRQAHRAARRWPRKSVPGIVEVDAAAARAQIVNMSYGGARLAFEPPFVVPQIFDITLSPGGVIVRANRIWTREDSDRLSCGAEVVEADDWRGFVDALRGPTTH